MNKAIIKLTFDNQLKFKDWAKTQGLDPNQYYFDNIYVVNAATNKNIPGIYANGHKTWGEALAIVKGYFDSI